MNKLILAFLTSISLFLFTMIPAIAYASTPDRIIIKFHTTSSEQTRDSLIKQFPVSRRETLRLANTEVISVPQGQGQTLSNILAKNPNVQYAEEDEVAEATNTPDDPYFVDQWGLQKILAPSAWDYTQGSASILIAVVDTGIDGSHPDLTSKIAGRANFTTDSDVDDNGHGSHVAGIAAADTNNGIGVAGTGFNTDLLSVKVLEGSGNGYYSWVANGITWAADNGAKIINLSLGGLSSSQTLQQAVAYAWSKGAIVVAASGNNGNSIPFYPAYYPNVVSVAATDTNDQKAYFSNYGNWVTIAAPGVNIISTYQGGYAYLSGTSMATPFVSGVAALIWSEHPEWTNAQVVSQLESSADHIPGTGSYWQYGRVDACAAVDCIETTPTPTIVPTMTPTPTPAPTTTPFPTPTVTPTIIHSPTVTPHPTVIPPTPTIFKSVTPTLTPIPTITPTTTPSKPWWCSEVPWYPSCQ
jgi:thermitase